jgi:hypothetical protein
MMQYAKINQPMRLLVSDPTLNKHKTACRTTGIVRARNKELIIQMKINSI